MLGGRSTLRLFVTALAVAALAGASSGCTRSLYRRQADREAHYLIREKSLGTPWAVPDSFTIAPDQRSRFFDATSADFPTLPPAGPSLYQYQLPMRGAGHSLSPATRSGLEQRRSPEGAIPPVDDLEMLPPPPGTRSPNVPRGQAEATPAMVRPVVYRPVHAGRSAPSQEDPFQDDVETILESGRSAVRGLRFQAVEARFWEEIPDQVLARMREFASVVEEYRLTFQQEPSEELIEPAPYLTLDDFFKLALMNSREYQREKELLYEAALNLSLERFAYATKLSVRGATVDSTYVHSRRDGTTVNTLSVPSTLAGDKLLATGGTLVGQFANDVLLTFNGPNGFAADVSSELLFDITQRVLQRDILLEPLIQSERNVVYAARRFARFRKEFFFLIASSYYNSLLTYRSVEIDAQNYFSQVRNFQQQQEEVRSGISLAPTVVSLNQFEQGVLRARSTLIGQSLRLDDTLDRFKLILGLPTETPINVDLSELEQLTLRDRLEVNREQARRWQIRLLTLLDEPSEENHSDILSTNYSLADRLINWFSQLRRVDPAVREPVELYRMRAEYRLDGARLVALAERAAFQELQTAVPPRQRILVFQRQMDLIATLQELIERQGRYATRTGIDARDLDGPRTEFQELIVEIESLEADFITAVEDSPDEQHIIGFIDRATRLLASIETLTQNLDDLIFGEQIDTVDLEETLAKTKTLLAWTEQAFADAEQGLPPLDISVDDAMLTALVQRLDLMNERGALADRWRDIKIAADELRSRLDLQASQRIGTEKNRPFAFSTDNANTRLRVAVDLPLNRKRDRNLYRRALISYHAELRGLQAFEDGIKLSIRQQMRNLEQARVQYPIAVTQAVIAEEQVLSTRLQLILGLPGVRALDLLLAYDDSREALGTMVDRRIGYILDRARFALELEAMILDDTGFWPEINDPRYQPEPDFVYPWNAGSAYGDFPSFLKVSPEYRRMLDHPPPGATVDP